MNKKNNNPYITEFRDKDKAQLLVRQIAAEARPEKRYRFTGILRRSHARSGALGPAGSAAREHPHDSRPGLPGVRAADRTHRHGA